MVFSACLVCRTSLCAFAHGVKSEISLDAGLITLITATVTTERRSNELVFHLCLAQAVVLNIIPSLCSKYNFGFRACTVKVRC